jgi:phosphomannomutase
MSTLMLGVSGLRGLVGESLSPEVIGAYAHAFISHLKATESPANGKYFVVVLGRDSRPSGGFVRDAAVAALTASGAHVIDLGVVTTPGTAMMVKKLNADAGIVATASHNPIIWNGLKLLDRRGIAPPPSFIAKIIERFRSTDRAYVSVDKIVASSSNDQTNAHHVDRVLSHVDVLGIASKRFKVVIDSINGAGCVGGSTLLSKLGCNIIQINGEPTGQFAHEPEPTEKNLTDLCSEVRRQKAHVGFAQDPDADRLAIVDENGRYIGEEYTLALASEYILRKKPGSLAAANLSTSRMLDDIAARHGGRVIRTPVGEANVVEGMLAHGAIIGGEGNGGVIDPRIVAGRDSLTSIAYTLALMAEENRPLSQIVDSLPRYVIIKDKFECRREDADRAVAALKQHFASEKVDTQDGIRIDWPDAWVHARPSNTEPIMRIIAEAPTRESAESRIKQVQQIVHQTLNTNTQH